jgi:hypothetical protein
MVAKAKRVVDDAPRVVDVPGIPDGVEFNRRDFISDRSWERLCLGFSVDKRDFADTKQYLRYWFITNSLTEGICLLSGMFGHGKSAMMYFLGYMLRELFGKSCTFDVAPLDTFGYSYEYAEHFIWNDKTYDPPPIETLGRYRTIKTNEFTEELEKIGKMAEIEKEVERGNISRVEFNRQLADIKLYNSFIGIDEAYDKLEKRRQSNFGINMGHLMMKMRHFHNMFVLVSPKADRIDKGMAYDIRTHEIYAYKDPFTHVCTYRIWWRAANRWTRIELTPAEWSFLWKSDNIIGGSILKIKGEQHNEKKVKAE